MLGNNEMMAQANGDGKEKGRVRASERDAI